MATKSKISAVSAVTSVTLKEFDAVRLELDQAKTVANNNIQLATFFANAQMSIDNRIMATSFKGNIKNTIVWIISNRKEIIELLKYIIGIVKQVKDKLEDLRKNAPQPDAQ
jgi:hypothetical protein